MKSSLVATACALLAACGTDSVNTAGPDADASRTVDATLDVGPEAGDRLPVAGWLQA